MAGGNTVTLTFAGDDRNLSRVLAGLNAKTATAGDGMRKFGTVTALAVPALGYTAGAVVGLSGALAVMPSMAFAGALGLGALAIGTQGFGDALSSMDDPAKFAEAIGKLAPEARATAVAIRDLKPQFDGLKTAVQNQLFAGLSTELRDLTGALLPTMQSQLVATAGSLNATAKGFTGWMSAPSTVADINTALDGSRGFLDGILRSLLPVTQAFLDIGVVAAPYVRQMGDALAGAAQRFGDFVARARESGALNDWVAEGLGVFKQLWNVITDLGAVIVNLGLAFESAGLPTTLEMVSGALRRVSEFIRDNSAVMVPLITIVGGLVLAFKGIMAVVGVINAVRSATVLWTAAQWLFNAAMWANPVTWIVIGIIALIAAIVLCIVYWDEIREAAVRAVGWITQKWAEAVAWLTGIWNSIKGAAAAIWGAITAWISNKVAEVIAFIGQLAQIPGRVGAWFGEMKDRAVALALQLVAWVAGLPARIWSGIAALGQLGARVGAWFLQMKDAAVAKASELAGWMRGLPGRIMSALGNLASLLVGAGRDVVNGLWRGIQAGWAWLTGAVRNLAGSLLSAAKGALGIASPSKLFRDEVGRWIPEGLAEGIIRNAGAATDAARQVGADAAAAAAAAAQSAPLTGLGLAAQTVLDRMRSRGSMFEDLTWRGMPDVVGQFNDQLLDMAKAQGVNSGNTAQMQAFLASVSGSSAPRPATSSTAVPALAGVRSSTATSPAPVQVVINVAGSIRSDRELVALIRDEMDRGGFRGVRN